MILFSGGMFILVGAFVSKMFAGRLVSGTIVGKSFSNMVLLTSVKKGQFADS